MYVCSYKWVIVDTTYGVEHASSDVCKKVRINRSLFCTLCAYIYTYKCVHMYVYIYTYAHMYILMYRCMRMLIATYIHMNFMKLCTNINAYTYVYTYMITLQFSCLGINS